MTFVLCHDNFFLFTPMLHEVAASDLDLTKDQPATQTFLVGNTTILRLSTLFPFAGINARESKHKPTCLTLSLGKQRNSKNE
jgi:hypothetical protein